MTRGVDHTRLPWPHGKSFCAECDEEWPCEVTELRADLAELHAVYDFLADSHCDCCTGERKAEAAIARVRELCHPDVARPSKVTVYKARILAAIEREQP